MKTIFILFLFCVSACFQCSQLAAQEKKIKRGFTPLTPQQLLKAMPAVPDGWQLKMSTASTEFADWLEAHAERLYQFPAKVKGDPPAQVRISILDTASQSEEMPTVERKRNGVEIYKILIEDRFVVEIMQRNSADRSAKEWFTKVDVVALKKAGNQSREIDRPDNVTIVEIDELDSTKNATYVTNVGHGKGVNAALAPKTEEQRRLRNMLAPKKTTGSTGNDVPVK